MYNHFVGYRHNNNEVEGFVGHGLTAIGAERNAIRKVVEKVAVCGNAYEESRLLKSKRGVTKSEVETIKEDWKLLQKQ
jgi:hypothetical protein